MANKTTYFNLTKPVKTEKVDINVINTNMDMIDSALKSIDDTLSSLSTQFKYIFIGTKSEYEKEHSKGNIIDGSLVIITDDETRN